MVDFDYIIVGAGAAGCVLANRLSKDPKNQVLLLEYGGRDRNPMIYVPKGFYFTLRGQRYTYHYPTRPVGPAGQVEVWTRGKGLGGSTAVNGMMWMRGAAADWDGLAARGNPAFGWERALSAYRAMEDHNLGASDMRGAGGPLGVSVVEDDDKLVQAVLASAQDMGWEYVSDVNAHDSERVGFSPSTIRHGVRSSGYSAFVRPVRRRRNLTVATRARAGYLLFDGSRVVGVRAMTGGRAVVYRARKEVILSGHGGDAAVAGAVRHRPSRRAARRRGGRAGRKPQRRGTGHRAAHGEHPGPGQGERRPHPPAQHTAQRRLAGVQVPVHPQRAHRHERLRPGQPVQVRTRPRPPRHPRPLRTRWRSTPAART
jgi:GMC oxidoreductase